MSKELHCALIITAKFSCPREGVLSRRAMLGIAWYCMFLAICWSKPSFSLPFRDDRPISYPLPVDKLDSSNEGSYGLLSGEVCEAMPYTSQAIDLTGQLIDTVGEIEGCVNWLESNSKDLLTGGLNNITVLLDMYTVNIMRCYLCYNELCENVSPYLIVNQNVYRIQNKYELCTQGLGDGI